MKKAGYPGWSAFVPVYNIYLLTKIAGRSGWWTLAFFIPFINLAASLLIWTEIGDKFGKSSAFSTGLAWMNWIFLPALALGDAEMERPTLERPQHLSSEFNVSYEGDYKTYQNDNGDWIEEVPLEDW